MNRREFLLASCLLAQGCVWADAGRRASSTRPPNIVFILADDLGWADLSCYGSRFHETPNLDRLAAQGLRFTQAYAAAPVCSPTRASIMTGQYPARVHVTNFLKGTRSPADSPVLTAPYADQLDLSEITVAEVLRAAGYHTAHIGKWHLGKDPYSPENQGFEDTIARGDGVRSYFWPDWKNSPAIEGDYAGQYVAEKLAKEACRYIEAHREAPFYINLCHFSVHIPIQAPADKIAKYTAKLQTAPPAPGAQNNPHYAAMVEALDDSVGLVLDTLEKTGLAENTLVAFFSDNGGLSVLEGDLTPATTNAPLRAGKGYLYEGGIREPLIMRWPGHTPPGSVCDVPVNSVDFLPTFASIAHADPKSYNPDVLDGIDISAQLENPQHRPDRSPMCWHYPHFANQGGMPSGAIRDGDWKLIEFFETGKLELYHLRDDVGEQTDLASQQPDRVRQMHDALKQWRIKVNATMPPPNPSYRPANTQ